MDDWTDLGDLEPIRWRAKIGPEEHVYRRRATGVPGQLVAWYDWDNTDLTQRVPRERVAAAALRLCQPDPNRW